MIIQLNKVQRRTTVRRGDHQPRRKLPSALKIRNISIRRSRIESDKRGFALLDASWRKENDHSTLGNSETYCDAFVPKSLRATQHYTR